MASPFSHSCPLCDAPASAASRRLAERTFVHCAQCDLIHVPAAEHLPPLAERDRYLKHQNSITDTGYVATFDPVLRVLERHAADAERVLDFGAGPSPVLVNLLQQRGYDAVGYDPWFAADTDVTGPFDAILSVETFEHLRDPATEIRMLRRALATGATLIVKTLFHKGLASLEGWHYIRDRTHIVFYSSKTFEWIAAAFDLRLVECDDEALACLLAAP